MALLERACHSSSSLHTCSCSVSRHTSKAEVTRNNGPSITFHSLGKWKLPSNAREEIRVRCEMRRNKSGEVKPHQP